MAPTEQKTDFIYDREIWFWSALIDSKKINMDQQSKKIKDLLKERLISISDEDLKKLAWNPAAQNLVKEMVSTVEIKKFQWHKFVDFYPFQYLDENLDQEFNKLGYFEIELEYFPDNPERKKEIMPVCIQQAPGIILDYFKEHVAERREYAGIQWDLKSPIFVFVASHEFTVNGIEWTDKNIEKYKRDIGKWVEVYSGSWPDYNKKLYQSRVKNNLSNRLSELHFIRQNSGFIYMKEENFKMFFEKEGSYMRTFVLKPTAEIRSMQFVLSEVINSLDLIFRLYHDKSKKIEEKIQRLKSLRGSISNHMSTIYSELDKNSRPHYTKVLKDLLEEFRFKQMLKRMNNKFEAFSDIMEMTYQKLEEESNSRQEKRINLLNYLFGLGILADLADLLVGGGVAEKGTSITVLVTMFGILLWSMWKFRGLAEEDKDSEQVYRTVDGIVQKDNKVLLIRRKFPPFQGFYALPGGFIEEEESEKNAVIREMKEETGLSVEIRKKFGVFDEKGRDPRGYTVSNVYVCDVREDSEPRASSDAMDAKFVEISKAKDLQLAFDHNKILDKFFNEEG